MYLANSNIVVSRRALKAETYPLPRPSSGSSRVFDEEIEPGLGPLYAQQVSAEMLTWAIRFGWLRMLRACVIRSFQSLAVFSLVESVSVVRLSEHPSRMATVDK